MGGRDSPGFPTPTGTFGTVSLRLILAAVDVLDMLNVIRRVAARASCASAGRGRLRGGECLSAGGSST